MKKFEDIDSYIEKIEESINLSEDREKDVGVILANLLDKFKFFTDPRALRSTNISALTELIDCYQSAPVKRAGLYKSIIELIMKKEELEMKKKDREKTEVLTGPSISVRELMNQIRKEADCYVLPNYNDTEELIAVASQEDQDD